VQRKTATYNVQRALNQRLRRLAFRKRLSKSSIVEIALRQFLDGRSDEEIVEELLSRGAGLRRKATHEPLSVSE